MSKSPSLNTFVRTFRSVARFTEYRVARVPAIGKPVAQAIHVVAGTTGTVAGNAASGLGASRPTAKAVGSLAQSTTKVVAGECFLHYVDKK